VAIHQATSEKVVSVRANTIFLDLINEIVVEQQVAAEAIAVIANPTKEEELEELPE
jgi:hypothetical protein